MSPAEKKELNKYPQMKQNKLYVLFLLLALIPVLVQGQQAEYNWGNNWVHPGGQKFVGMDFVNSSTGTVMNNATVWYSGNFTNDGRVDFDNSLVVNPGQTMFASDALQHIAGSGTTRFYSLMFGSLLTPMAYNLEQNISVVRLLNLTKGILNTLQTTPETMMNMLQLENGATCINASASSYVDGFVSKTGNSTFTFPIGNGGFYRPASISAPAAVTDCFAARYLYVNPDNAGYTRSQKVTTLTRISDKEYWVVNHTSGTTNGELTLSWNVSETSAPVPANLNALVVARWDGVKWINEGNTSTTGNATAGTITATVTGYGIFTLANRIVDPPVVVNDSITTLKNNPVTGTVLANDSVFNGSKLTLTSFSISGINYQSGSTVTIPNVGTITIGADGVFTYSPVLNYNGVLPTITYTVSDGDIKTDSGELIINVLPLPELIKTSGKPIMNNDGSFSWTYTLTLHNDTQTSVSNIQVEDNLDDVFSNKGCTYSVTQILATGGLTANGFYNGSGNVKTLIDGLSMSAGQLDSIRIEVNVNTHGQSDTILVFNQAILTAKAIFGEFSMKSHANKTSVLATPTQTNIPVIKLFIPDGFSPNGDGVNDKFVIVHEASIKLDIEIANRSGNVVYKSSDYQNDWDGKSMGSFFGGNDLPNGTYFVTYKAIKISTGEIVTKAVKFITLRRN